VNKIKKEDLCIRCLKRKKEQDSDYCSYCKEHFMLETNKHLLLTNRELKKQLRQMRMYAITEKIRLETELNKLLQQVRQTRLGIEKMQNWIDEIDERLR